jgi:DNA-binding transcriptional ArsR family regulator
MSGRHEVSDVLAAVADPTRRRVLDLLGERPAASASALARALPVSRQAVLKHLAVLAECGLVTSVKDGREVRYSVRSDPLVATASWLNAVAAGWDERLADLKRRAEQR